MAKRVSEARRRVFFEALAATGNMTVAAGRARVSRTWAKDHRRDDPAFRAAVDAALATARAQLAPVTSVRPASRWRNQDGEALLIRGSGGRWQQIARARATQWTPRVEADFLRVLATSCNVSAACRAVGRSASSAYAHRNRWQSFAERWDAAIEQGYDRLSMALTAAAGAMLGDADFVPEPGLTGMTVDAALQLMRLHHARITGEGRRPGRQRQPMPIEAIHAAVLRRVAIVTRAGRAAAGRAAAGRQG